MVSSHEGGDGNSSSPIIPPPSDDNLLHNTNNTENPTSSQPLDSTKPIGTTNPQPSDAPNNLQGPTTNPINYPSDPFEYYHPSDPFHHFPIKNLNNAHHSISIKLTPTNYLLWSNQLTYFFKGQGLFEYVTGEIPQPSPFSPQLALWQQQDAAIMSCLISSLSEPLMPEAIGKVTSQALWNSLRTTYARASTARTLNLRGQLRDLKQGDMKVAEFLNKAKLIADDLASIGKAFSNDEFLSHIFDNLRPELGDLKPSILARNDAPEFEEVKNALIEAEASIERRLAIAASVLPTPDPPAPSAHLAKAPFGSDLQQSASAPAYGNQPPFYSGYRGQTSRFPRGRTFSRSRGRGAFQSRFQQRSQWEQPRLTCQLCGQRDHLATACPQHLQSSPSAHSVYSRAPSRHGSTWYPDSGATHHVTPDLSQLQLHEDFSGSDRLRVADGAGQNYSESASQRHYQ